MRRERRWRIGEERGGEVVTHIRLIDRDRGCFLFFIFFSKTKEKKKKGGNDPKQVEQRFLATNLTYLPAHLTYLPIDLCMNFYLPGG